MATFSRSSDSATRASARNRVAPSPSGSEAIVGEWREPTADDDAIARVERAEAGRVVAAGPDHHKSIRARRSEQRVGAISVAVGIRHQGPRQFGRLATRHLGAQAMMFDAVEGASHQRRAQDAQSNRRDDCTDPPVDDPSAEQSRDADGQQRGSSIGPDLPSEQEPGGEC